jgi:thiamine biosynthesis lipoprotein
MWPRAKVASVLACAGLLVACTPEPVQRSETLLVFGSESEFRFVDAPDPQIDAALGEIAELLSGLHSEWHAWEAGPLSAINEAIAIGSAAPATDSIQRLITRAQAASAGTDQLFDPAAGGLVALWGFHTSSFPVTQTAPSAEAIRAWVEAAPTMADVRVEGGLVFSRNRRVKLDFGGMAEGMAVEMMLEVLQRHALVDVLITMGGDIYALGDAGGRPWKVAVRDPYGGVLGTVQLEDGEALFSSGNYNKFRESPDGGRWPHILDPRTGYPVRGTAAVAVLHSDPVLADVASTALFIAGPAKFESMAKRLEVRCALMLTDENELMITSAMDARIVLQRQPVRLGPSIGELGSCGPAG